MTRIDMIRIDIDVPAVPVPQPRQRTRIVTGDNGAFVHNYTPKEHPVNAFKAGIREAFRRAWSHAPLRGPVEIEAYFFMPRVGRMIWARKPMPRKPHTVRPDLDNMIKAVKDSLRGLAWMDDSQVWRLVSEKQYCHGDESPHLLLRIHSEETK